MVQRLILNGVTSEKKWFSKAKCGENCYMAAAQEDGKKLMIWV